MITKHKFMRQTQWCRLVGKALNLRFQMLAVSLIYPVVYALWWLKIIQNDMPVPRYIDLSVVFFVSESRVFTALLFALVIPALTWLIIYNLSPKFSPVEQRRLRKVVEVPAFALVSCYIAFGTYIASWGLIAETTDLVGDSGLILLIMGTGIMVGFLVIGAYVRDFSNWVVSMRVGSKAA